MLCGSLRLLPPSSATGGGGIRRPIDGGRLLDGCLIELNAYDCSAFVRSIKPQNAAEPSPDLGGGGGRRAQWAHKAGEAAMRNRAQSATMPN